LSYSFTRPWRVSVRTLALFALGSILLVACSGAAEEQAEGIDEGTDAGPLVISAIPDQDPEVLSRIYERVAEWLSETLEVEVEYAPVTDYTASVSLFRSGDLDLVWFGGLTGVQARLQTPGARALAQRDIDAEFHSVFVASVDSGIEPFDDLTGLTGLEGKRFTFGSESSTSGRLMPEYFLGEAGVGTDEFAGEVGFSGSHDRTIELVTSGSYEAGVLNEQVWLARMEEGAIDTDSIILIYRTPAYHDYHWVVGPTVDEEFGPGFSDRIAEAFVGLDPNDPVDAVVLDAFGAGSFIETEDDNYAQIEEVARQLDLIE
jgi:phosphonate transport system substrate-binding protein